MAEPNTSTSTALKSYFANRQIIPWAGKILILLLIFMLPLSAEDDENYDDDFFALPSPNEILAESEELGLKIKVTRKVGKVLRTNFAELAKKDELMTTYKMGRVFAIAGFSFKDLDNKVILGLAGKIYGGTSALKLPDSIHNEISLQYKKMLRNPKWNREELMISFTAARSSLMYLLKDKKKVSDKDRPRLESLALCLELGIWYQSIFLATQHLTAEKIDSFYEVYMDEDVLDYFKRVINKSLKTNPKHEFLLKLKAVNDECIKIMKDEKIDQKEVDALKPILNKVID